MFLPPRSAGFRNRQSSKSAEPIAMPRWITKPPSSEKCGLSKTMVPESMLRGIKIGSSTLHA